MYFGSKSLCLISITIRQGSGLVPINCNTSFSYFSLHHSKKKTTCRLCVEVKKTSLEAPVRVPLPSVLIELYGMEQCNRYQNSEGEGTYVLNQPPTFKVDWIIFSDWRHCAALSILRCHLPGGCPGKLHCHLHCVHFQENAGEWRPSSQLTAFTRNGWLFTDKEKCRAQSSNARGIVEWDMDCVFFIRN